MTMVQRVAQVFGGIFVVIAVWGFLVTGTSMEADPAMAPRILGLFAVNVLHNLVHLGFGIWGLVASRSFPAAVSFARIAGIIYLVLAVLGFITPTTFGLIPIGGHDIWLHALIGVALVGVGFSADKAPAADTAAADERAATPPPATPPATPPAGSRTERPDAPGGAPDVSPPASAPGATPADRPMEAPPPRDPEPPAAPPPPREPEPPARDPEPPAASPPPPPPPPPGPPPGGPERDEPDRGA